MSDTPIIYHLLTQHLNAMIRLGIWSFCFLTAVFVLFGVIAVKANGAKRAMIAFSSALVICLFLLGSGAYHKMFHGDTDEILTMILAIYIAGALLVVLIELYKMYRHSSEDSELSE